jgi:hypothetical protein
MTVTVKRIRYRLLFSYDVNGLLVAESTTYICAGFLFDSYDKTFILLLY